MDYSHTFPTCQSQKYASLWQLPITSTDIHQSLLTISALFYHVIMEGLWHVGHRSTEKREKRSPISICKYGLLAHVCHVSVTKTWFITRTSHSAYGSLPILPYNSCIVLSCNCGMSLTRPTRVNRKRALTGAYVFCTFWRHCNMLRYVRDVSEMKSTRL